MRIAEDDPRPHGHELVGEEHPRLEHLLVNEHRALALGGRDQRDGREIGRKGGPGSVIDLGNRAEGVLADRAGLVPVHRQDVPIHRHPNPEALEGDERGVQVLDGRVLDGELAPRHGGEADERARLDVVGSDPVRRPPETLHALDLQGVGADPGDPGTHGVEEVAEVLDVGLGGRIVDPRGPPGQDGGHDGVLRPGHGRLVQEDPAAPEPVVGSEPEAPVQLHFRAQGLEGQEMGIHPAAPDDISPGWGEAHPAEAGQEGTGQQERRPDPLGHGSVHRAHGDPRGVEGDRVLVLPLHPGAQRLDDLQEGLHVPNPGDVLHGDRLVGQDRGTEGG